MKKQLDTSFITSELSGNSAFFPNYKKETSNSQEDGKSVDTANTAKETNNSKGVPPPVPRTVPRPVPLEPKIKKQMRQRQPFDIYEDQYRQLKKISEDEKGFVNGRGMSQMVREAIDNYLKNHSPIKE